VLVCCDLCRDTLNVDAYYEDPLRSGWKKHKPRAAPGLAAWHCPECQARSTKKLARARAA